jgi:putative hydrolase of the HAD superfamily
MRRFFIFDFDDTIANFPLYNSLRFRVPLDILPPMGGLIPGASDVLDMILKRKDRLHMLTMNIMMDEGSKWKKMNSLGISRWFDESNVTMVRRKTPEMMLSITKGFPRDRCYMVGNSLTHDVEPAIEAGIGAIYIPRPRMKRLIPRSLPDSDRLLILKDIRDMIDIYDRL